MAASSSFPSASTEHSSTSSGFFNSFSSGTGANQSASDDADVEFGSFSAAERTSDPYADIYGSTTDFSDPIAVAYAQQEAATAAAADSSLLMSFSPLTAPAPAPTTSPPLLTRLSSDADPFADITGGLGASGDANDTAASFQTSASSRGEVVEAATAPTSSSSATAAILDLVWGNTTPGEEETQSTGFSGTSGDDRTDAGSRRSSNANGFFLPPPPSSETTPFPLTAGPNTAEASTGDLLSFSPVQASTPSDPFFGLSNDGSDATTDVLAFGGDDLFPTTTNLSSSSSSAPGSLHGSFASFKEGVKPPALSPTTPGSDTTSPRDPFAERTTRSFGSLSSSFVSVGVMEDAAGHNGRYATFGAFTTPTTASRIATASAAPSPASAPASLRNSINMTEDFTGLASAADESDGVDPFEEAGLSFDQVPLADALTAWDTSEQPTVQAHGESNYEDSQLVEQNEVIEDNLSQTENALDDQRIVEESDNDSKTLEQAAQVIDSLTTRNESELIATITNESEDLIAADSQAIPVEAVESITAEKPSMVSSSESIDPTTSADDNELDADKNHDNGFEGDESDSNDDCIHTCSDDDAAINQSTIELEETTYEEHHVNSFSRLTPTTADSASSDEDASIMIDKIGGSISSPTAKNQELKSKMDELNEAAAVWESSHEEQIGDVSTDIGDFGDFESTAPDASVISAPDASVWGSFAAPTPAPNMLIGEDDDFGDFTEAAPSATISGTATSEFEDDDFGDFTQSADAGNASDFDDFGDFEQSSTQNDGEFSGFQQSSLGTFEAGDNDFGDFTPGVAPASVADPCLSIPAPSFSHDELATFFQAALLVDPVQSNTHTQPECSDDGQPADAFHESSTIVVQDVFRSMWDAYISIVSAGGSHSPSSTRPSAETSDNSERVLLDKKTKHASKYLKYVLSEKIQEASRQNGVFPHGSEKHQMYLGFAASGDADRMRAALRELQDALFHSSVNDAMMRIAKEAALSAKAKIAEQAAQQQANSRGGSLFSTTRHLLSRGGSGPGGAHGPGSSGSDNKGDHAGADTPTSASVQKLARYAFPNSNDDSSNGHRGMSSSEERGSEGDQGHSSGSDGESVGGGEGRGRGHNLSNSGGSNGGLMKKFQDRFSFASTRHKPRFVSLRRKGQSGEEVRKMELNLDAISGGLDEVKWKCAMFLYDVEEVAHVAPSQIRILAYPSKLPLAGKTDRSALTKLVKPDTVWTVDIGANNSDMLNDW
ncbi:hypothetical protein PHYBOEH_009970 [Phytophthora boehmeriae]|uniref:Uncharacterized protein n=1 Tax=Phytophthora boehmeriae TaxID=109152 RepID=A0A8T1WYJ3_9STRA|nr:hypothetical protein PHYBOEH_009970 [Phytophthora boehmeriae]